MAFLCNKQRPLRCYHWAAAQQRCIAVPPAVLLDLLVVETHDLGRGGRDTDEQRQAPLAVAGQAVAMNICYEDVFGEEIIGASYNFV